MKRKHLVFMTHRNSKNLLLFLVICTLSCLFLAFRNGFEEHKIELTISLFVSFSFLLFYLHLNVWKPLVELDIQLVDTQIDSLRHLKDFKEYQIDPTGYVITESVSLIHQLSDDIQQATVFVKAIEQGNLEIDFSHLAHKQASYSPLALALVNMRDKMQAITRKEKERNWITEGLAKFSEILRMSNINEGQIHDEILLNVVKYLEVNQGGLYVIEEKKEGELYFELVSFYAYNRKKYMQQEYHIREGLLGQAYLEKDYIYLTEIPEDYVRITSGLGEALPRCLLIVPLMVNKEIVGAIELASFSVIPAFQIEFLLKLGENIASTLSGNRTVVKTRQLLQETQLQAEQMRNQEEEMRQNMEELHAIQEEMGRNEKGHLLEIERLQALHEENLNLAHIKAQELQEAQKETQKLMEEIQTSQESITKNYQLLFERFNQFAIESKFDQLMSIRSTKKRNIEDYFGTIRNQILTYAEDKMIVDAMKAFKEAFAGFGADLSEEQREHESKNVEEYYQNEFLPRLNTNKEEPETIEKYWDTEIRTLHLQYLYISSNENDTGKKHLLDAADDNSHFSHIHSVYHPIIRHFLLTFGYYDIFLIDNETGHIVYSVFKEVDYATSLLTGPYRNTNFAQVFREVRNAPKGFIKLVDFEGYDPSYTAPASFIATPIFEGEKRIGVLIFQMPIDKINSIMTGDKRWKEDGLGNSGETYLVGEDYKMRSISRFLIEDPIGYFNELQRIGYNENVSSKIKRLNTTILLQDVKTDAVIEALRGHTSEKIVLDYRGISVLSAYAKLAIQDVNWVICSDIDEEEVTESIAYVREMSLNS